MNMRRIAPPVGSARLSPLVFTAFTVAFVLGVGLARAADPVYSGPQPGEATTPFKVRAVGGSETDLERDPIVEGGGKPMALVFVHTVERSLVPLLRAIDGYGAARADRLRTEIVFLSGDRLEGERRIRAVAGSLQLRSRVGFSLDGAEGPGNYGLNKDCMMTIIAAKDNVVSTNFALVQPGIADAPAVIAALAASIGDSEPPDIATLTGRPAGRREQAAPMREAAGEGFPGAVPTDAKLNRLIREFIRPTNDDASVDRLLTEIESHVEGNADLTRQAIAGWTRILHFGDRYGTAHARETARASMERLKKRTDP